MQPPQSESLTCASLECNASRSWCQVYWHGVSAGGCGWERPNSHLLFLGVTRVGLLGTGAPTDDEEGEVDSLALLRGWFEAAFGGDPLERARRKSMQLGQGLQQSNSAAASGSMTLQN